MDFPHPTPSLSLSLIHSLAHSLTRTSEIFMASIVGEKRSDDLVDIPYLAQKDRINLG